MEAGVRKTLARIGEVARVPRNGLATPATVNQFSVAARQWQLKVTTKTPKMACTTVLR
jgi:hypothetical protein